MEGNELMIAKIMPKRSRAVKTPEVWVARQRLDARDAARYCALSRQTLAKMRVEGNGPGYMKVGGKIIYDAGVIDVWMASKAVASTSQTHAAR